jgi:uncharacterized protein HemX
MDDTRRTEPAAAIGRGVLQAIFTVFLGLMITAVVGVGVYTFHPNPAADTQEQVQALYQERERLQGCTSVQGCTALEELTEAERAELDAIDVQVLELQEAADAQREAWSQSTSVILIVIATALMAVALLLGDSVTVLSNGILLGGLFTMLYGVGWGLASGNSLTRFLVLVAALAVSLGLGYLKFVRPRKVPADEVTSAHGPAAAGSIADPSSEQLAALTARVADLERRLAAAAAGLGDAGDPAGGRGS